MPTPIDELLITVEVEQGSKLEELHRMLKDFQSLGGKLEVDAEVPEMEEMKGYVVSAHDKINDLTNILIPIVTKYPTLLESIQNLINDNFITITNDIKILTEWKDDLNKNVSSILTNIQSILKAIDIVSQNIDKFKDEDFYKKIIDTLNEVTKNIKIVFQEQVFDEIKNKIDEIRQQVDINLLNEIKKRIDEILKLNFPKNFRNYMQTQVVNKIVKKLEEIIKEGKINIDDVKKACNEVFGDIERTYYEGTSYYGLDERDINNLLKKFTKEILDSLEFYMKGQSEINKRILDDIEAVRNAIANIYIPSGRSGLSSWDITDALKKALDAVDIKSVYEKTITLLNRIKMFVNTGGFTTDSKYFEEISHLLDSISLEIKMEVALKSQSTKLLEEMASLKTWLDEEMARRASIWGMETEISQMQDTVETRIPKKSWKDGFSKVIESELSIFKEKLDTNLRKVLGSELDDWKERTEAMEDVAKMREGVPKILQPTRVGGNLLGELQYIKGMLNEVAQHVVMGWIEELGILTREMLFILEDFGEKIFEKMSKMGGDWNALLHNYLRQELKIDRFTDLLGKKIEYEKKEFADLQKLLYNFDIPEKFEVLHEKIDNLAEILGVTGGWEEALGGIDYIWDKIQHLLKVLRMNEEILTVLKEVPDFDRMGPVTESLESLMKILSTAKDVREALLMWRGTISGARAGLRNIDHVSQIVETKRVLELEKITRGSRVEDISEIIEDQVIRPYFKVWKEIAKGVKVIDKKIEEVKSLEEQNMDKDSLNKTKLKE